MNATKNHIGKNQVTGRKTTRRVTSTIGQVRSLASKTKDLERNSERQTEVCTNSNASNGFLKCKFLPKQEEVSHFQGSKKILNTERDL